MGFYLIYLFILQFRTCQIRGECQKLFQHSMCTAMWQCAQPWVQTIGCAHCLALPHAVYTALCCVHSPMLCTLPPAVLTAFGCALTCIYTSSLQPEVPSLLTWNFRQVLSVLSLINIVYSLGTSDFTVLACSNRLWAPPSRSLNYSSLSISLAPLTLSICLHSSAPIVCVTFVVRITNCWDYSSLRGSLLSTRKYSGSHSCDSGVRA